MKARIITKIPERVLLFAIDNTVKAQLEDILNQMDIQSHTVSDCELGQDVGYLAGFHGFQEKKVSDITPPTSEGILCMCGMPSKRVDCLLKNLKEHQIDIPIKATVTATNQKWSFGALVEELNREHKAILKQQNSR
ncbi:MAG: DUF3783 domain-containing protein [Clostridium sp.]|nr:DUF3783 domain-containing protein [Clostridium sp.]